ncbi:MAG: methyltransferase domain-containing protein [Candidatus Omnitrophica bacterium]|nr:methyltransferase domain-containing protein [Candidatus Omnitrophota bacterium]MDD5591852.1 methyltransferase domain-containing protein [Candidatus Omnitrophota bacterium]
MIIKIDEKDIGQRRLIFEKKKVLQLVYYRWYKQIAKNLNAGGKTLEIGSGFGDFKRFFPSCVTSDIIGVRGVDLVFDANLIFPFRDHSFVNLVCIDVFHHLKDLTVFFKEASRILKQGGRVIIIDMYISIISYLVLRLFHFENIQQNGMVTGIFFKNRKQNDLFANEFSILRQEIHDFLVYPLSGGFNYPSMIPRILLNLFLSIEDKFAFLKYISAFKATVVLEKI